MDFDLIFTLIASFAILFIGTVIFLHDRNSRTNRLFAYLSVDTVFWCLFNYLSLTTPDPERAIIWIRLVLFFAIPHIILYYFFIKTFPDKRASYSRWIPVVAIIVMALTLTPLIFSGAHISDGRMIPEPGPLIPVFALTIVGFLIASIVAVIKKYISAERKEKKSWGAMLAGFLLTYLLLVVTNFVLVNTVKETKFLVYGPLFVLPMLIGIAYSIIRYNLLNVKAIATEMVSFLLLAVALVQIFLSKTTTEYIINAVLFIVYLSFSILLIKSVLKEVRQRERLELVTKQLAQANEKLKGLDKLKTEFLSLASHQLRSPLTAIKGYTSMLLDGDFGNVEGPQRDAVNRVFESSTHLTKVVEDLLNVSKIEQGGMKYEMAPFDFEKVASDLSTDLSVTAKNKGLALTYDTDSKGPYTVNGDMEKIRQVVLNIIDNSIKYTEKGTVAVHLSKDILSKKIKLSVIDTGVGISPETKEKLFQKFSRGEGGKMNTGGSGLGLYLAKQIAEAHKGSIEIDSPGLGKGSTFTIVFPEA